MYIKRIDIRNIRGFEKLQFDLTRLNGSYEGWTVFTGDNGSGKSTLFKAIAACLVGRDTARALQPSFVGWPRSGADSGESSILLEIVRVEDDDNLSTTGTAPSAPFPAKLVIKRSSKEPTLEASLPPLKKENYHTPDRTIWSSEAGGWFSCGYGPFRRVFGASSEATQQMVSANTTRYATMFNEAASLSQADRWIRDLDYKALEGRPEEKRQKEIILAILQDELMPEDLKIEKIDSDGLWLKDKNGTLLSWHDMSDGYRAALALLVDILRNMIAIYGSENLCEDAKGKLIVKRSGVVLIDEIDAHMHPEWQRRIGFWLKSHFPKVQFLVTTHSPIICQAADPNGIFKLPQPASGEQPFAVSKADYQTIIAARPDTILLTPAFGLQETRSDLAVEKRQFYAKIRSKERSGAELSQEEKAELKQLSLFADIEEEL